MQAGTPARSPSYLCAQVKRGPGTRGARGCPWVPAARDAPASSCAGRQDPLEPLGAAVGVAKAPGQLSPCPRGPPRCGNLPGPAAGSRGRAVRGDGAATRRVGVGVRAAPSAPAGQEHPPPYPLRGARPQLSSGIDIPLVSLFKSSPLRQPEKGRGRLPCSCRLPGCPQPLPRSEPLPHSPAGTPGPECWEGGPGGGGDNKWPDWAAWSRQPSLERRDGEAGTQICTPQSLSASGHEWGLQAAGLSRSKHKAGVWGLWMEDSGEQ